MNLPITQSCACLGSFEESGLDAFFYEETEFGHETAISNVEAITAVEKEALTNARQHRPWARLRRSF